MGVDMAKLREQHGLVQAQAESRAVEAIQNRFGNVSYKQGHRRGFWDAMQFASENPSALIPEPPTDDDREACEHCGWTGPRTQYLGDERLVVAHPDGPHPKDWLPALRNRGRGPITDEEPDDERIEAWHRVADHPVLKSCYDVDGPLIDSVLARLSRLADMEQTIAELAAACARGPITDEAVDAAHERLAHLIAPGWDDVRDAIEAARDAEAARADFVTRVDAAARLLCEDSTERGGDPCDQCVGRTNAMLRAADRA